jgi:ribosomal protein S18 acetylase RimI-like enzyme
MNTVKTILKCDLPRLERLWRDIECEEHPGDNGGGERAVQGLMRSLETFDFLSSDSFWIFASESEDERGYVGYATAARIPKADDRVGFLTIDELYVLSDYRRQGHATRILEMAVSHARNLGLEGVRLLVDPENTAARRLYDRIGLIERNLVLCEQRISLIAQS